MSSTYLAEPEQKRKISMGQWTKPKQEVLGRIAYFPFTTYQIFDMTDCIKLYG
jgi:hypothetical protein